MILISNPLTRWLGEKYDGVRALWNPRKQILYTRLGNPIQLLISHVSLFIDRFIDAEIWYFLILIFYCKLCNQICRFGRGTFPDAQSVLQYESFNTLQWPFLRY